MPVITVIVPTRGRNDLLPRALRSLFAQTFRDFEVVVVDDNPPDKRIRMDASLEPVLSESRVRVIEHDKPVNAAAARNCGLRAARGEWITYLDDDDGYQPTKLEKQLTRALETKLPLGLCGLAYDLVGRKRIRQSQKGMFSGNELLFEAVPGTPMIFHKHTDVLFDESLSSVEDAAFFFSLLRHFKLDRVFNVPEPLVDVYLHAGPRVNRNAEAAWKGYQLIHQKLLDAFDAKARQSYLLRAHLLSLKYRAGEWPETLRAAFELFRAQGIKESRLILNAVLFKIPGMNRFLV